MRKIKHVAEMYFPGLVEVYNDEFEIPGSHRGRKPSKLTKWGLRGLACSMGLLVAIGVANQYSGTSQNEPRISFMDRMYGEGSVESMLQRFKVLRRGGKK